MIPQNGLVSFPKTPEEVKEFTTYLYDFEKGDFILRDGKLIQVKGEEALKIWITKLLKTEKDIYEIYKDVDYGTNIQSLIVGNTLPLDFVKAEIQRQISEALLKHSGIDDVSEFTIQKVDDELHIGFRVNHIFEVNYNV